MQCYFFRGVWTLYWFNIRRRKDGATVAGQHVDFSREKYMIERINNGFVGDVGVWRSEENEHQLYAVKESDLKLQDFIISLSHLKSTHLSLLYATSWSTPSSPSPSIHPPLPPGSHMLSFPLHSHPHTHPHSDPFFLHQPARWNILADTAAQRWTEPFGVWWVGGGREECCREQREREREREAALPSAALISQSSLRALMLFTYAV